MTAFKINLTIVGAFVVAALATLLVAIALLAGRTGPTDEYFTEFANVAGLKYGSQVLFEGFPIGQVDNIEPSQEQAGRARFRVTMSITEGWQIPDDSVARSVAPGLLAAQTIAISAGKSTTMLAPGSTIRGGMTVGLQESFSSIAGSVDQLTDQSLIPLVDNLNRQVSVMGEILQKTDAFMKTTSEHWPAVMKNVETASDELVVMGEQLDTLLSDERIAALDRLITNLDKTAVNMQKASSELEQLMQAGGPDLKVAVRDFRYTAEALSRHAESFAQNLDSAALNFQEFSRSLRNNPSLLLRSPDAPDDPVPPLRRKE